MAQLSSPGVSVQVIDESFYTSAAPGTVPLIFVTSEEGKQNSSKTGTAPGTLKANAGKVYLLTSQKDLADTFGTPKFITDINNNPIHAGEQNEYGLQAAYSYLGISSRAYVVRADIDLAQLNKVPTPPKGTPADGTFWFNTKETKYGIFEWNGASRAVSNGQTFTVKNPSVITNPANVETVGNVPNVPKSSYGTVGNYAIVAISTLITLWYKKPQTSTPAGWVAVGSPEWVASWPTVQGTIANPTTDAANHTILTLTVQVPGSNPYPIDLVATTLELLVAEINNRGDLADYGVTAAAIDGKLTIYTNGLSIQLSGSMAVNVGITPSIYQPPMLAIAPHNTPPDYKSTNPDGARPTGSIWIKTTSPNLGASWNMARYKNSTSTWNNSVIPMYKDNLTALARLDATAGGLNLAGNTLYVKYNDSDSSPAMADFKIYRRAGTGATTVKSTEVTASTFAQGDTYAFDLSFSSNGSALWSAVSSLTFTGTGNAITNAEAIAAAINSVHNSPVEATITASNQISLQHIQGGEIKLTDMTNGPIMALFGSISDTLTTPTTNLYGNTAGDYIATLWSPFADDGVSGFATASSTAPNSLTPDGRLWCSSITEEVDILVNDGTTWVGCGNYDFGEGVGATNPTGPIVSASKPTTQKDGSILVDGDLWINTSDLDNYPVIYRFNSFTKKWNLVDKTDQTSENGILFHDARWNVDGRSADPSSIKELLTSNFLDFDAPDPALYPKGMLLWNLRRSGFNVKRFVQNYVDLTAKNIRYDDEFMGSTGSIAQGDFVAGYYPHVWVSDAANQVDGSGTFGRRAQRAVVVQALQALVNSNQDIRDNEAKIFNLIACPGYPELVGEMKSLNYDRGITAFVVADTPARLTPDATSLSDWGSNQAGAVEDNDKGLVTSDEYVGFFYPWGYHSDNLGNNIAVPPSHMMLRTIALSDNVSYPWFAPAGTRRGGITNATNVGYITSEGEFKTVALNTGQRDTLQIVKVNPITFINGAGIVNYGQYTRAKNASSLDRINVARLVVYLRQQFSVLAKPYLFEPNDTQTRNQIKYAAEQLMLELMGKRAIYDYIVVCDESNNTPARIDRNELYLDVAIEPVKSVEFIYIPLRLKNTGEIKGLGA